MDYKKVCNDFLTYLKKKDPIRKGKTLIGIKDLQ